MLSEANMAASKGFGVFFFFLPCPGSNSTSNIKNLKSVSKDHMISSDEWKQTNKRIQEHNTNTRVRVA